MMNKEAIEKSMCTIDLTKLDGDGSFSCPKCGTLISPDDESEETYRIVKTEVKGDELSELVLACKKCKTVMKLTGFMSQPET
jgi:predicted RNA-binding Zn-ribbon protein involved in translation (DUF1610 family)